ncbi:MAG: class I SAM-dependent methyltransferase [Myxococcota bacterium]|nr:class I SAM-dependent methyltransferase [Myxococcota bacterium]
MSDLIPSFSDALLRRDPFFRTMQAEQTDCYRLFHGAVEGCPGLSIDRYGNHLLFQTWREAVTAEQIEALHALACTALQCELTSVWNDRSKRGAVQHETHPISETPTSGVELGLRYDVRLRHEGIDPLLFLDFRAGRRWMRRQALDKDVLNLFAYTCGIGVAALAGGAKQVLNVDFAARSLEIGRRNAQYNQLDVQRFKTLKENVIPVIRQFAGLGIRGRAARRKYTRLSPRLFDIVVLDPPRLSKSPFGKVDLVSDYASLFKPALLCTRPGGKLIFTNNVASVEESAWHERLEKSAKKAGRPLQTLIPLRPEEDFPSFDQRWPLKMAILHV